MTTKRLRNDGIVMEHMVLPGTTSIRKHDHWWRASRGGTCSEWFRDSDTKTGYQRAVDDLKLCESLEAVPCT